MNENLLQKLADVWDKIVTAIQTGLDQAPAYIQDLAYRWVQLQLWKKSISLFIWFVIFCLVIRRAVYLIKAGKEEKSDYGDPSGYYAGAFFVILIPGTILLICMYSEISAILWYSMVPELYILQDIKQFLQ